MEARIKKWQMPDTYVIIFFIVLIAALMTYVLPMGKFDISYEAIAANEQVLGQVAEGEVATFTVDGTEYTLDASGEKTLLLSGTEELGSIKKSKAKAIEVEGFRVIQVYGQYVTEGNKLNIKIFEKWGDMGFLNYMFEGFVSGDKWGSAVGVMAFILIVGGSFGIVLRTGAVDNGILKLIDKTKGFEVALIPIMFVLFSLGGAVFGMGEEAIPFAMILVPVMVAMGYDAVTGVFITYIATQVGFAASWMNPFSVAIAQGIAGLQVGSGSGFRITMWVVFTAVGIAFTMVYALWVKKNPTKSISYHTDAYFRNEFEGKSAATSVFGIGHALVLSTIVIGIVWIIWGVNEYEYYLPEIATIFFTMGLASGIIALIFKLDNMHVNDIASSFRKGAADLVGAAMVVGMAQGIVLVLGGTGAGRDTVMNTILAGMANALNGMPTVVTAWFMYIFQSVFNFFVVSGSGQAALTMPLMAPLAQLVGVSKQVAVLAFQLGDGLTNCIVPTSAALMGALGVARIEWTKWFKVQIIFQGIVFVLASLFVVGAVLINLQ
jgi:uncharacterized ion transporter superfamily protein YfcC